MNQAVREEDQASWASLRHTIKSCGRCPLGSEASQAVLGAGPAPAAMMLVGEGPSHEDDLTGQAHAGPAGRLLAEALVRAGVRAQDVFATFAVKHFGWRAHGARRVPRRPTAAELAACTPHLQAELALVRPRLIVALGAAAMRALLPRPTPRHEEARARLFVGTFGTVLVTHHPAAIVRLRGTRRDGRMSELVADLTAAQRLLQHTRDMPSANAAGYVQ